MTEIATTNDVLTGRFETTDLDEHAESMAAWQIRFDQLSKGPFQTAVEFVQAPAITIYRQWWNQHLNAVGETPSGYAYFGAPVSRRGEMRWRGQILDARHIAHGPPGLETGFSPVNGMDCFVLLVRPALLERHLGQEVTRALVSSDHVTSGPRARAVMTDTVERLIKTIAADPERLSERAAVDAFEFELLDVLAENLQSGIGLPRTGSRSKRHAALRRALDYADEVEQPVPVPKIAEVVGISQRTLEYAFVEHFGIPPIRYLRYARMNKLRRFLVEAEPATASVTGAAAQFGFSEMGRLASEYRAFFGETPSATLRRRVSRAPVQLAMS